MENKFQENLKILASQYTQRQIAEKTGFSQSSINNYLSGASEPSMSFLIALKDSFGISLDDFLFSDYVHSKNVSYDRFLGNYIAYYYNNNAYKGEVHADTKSTLNYGVISVLRDDDNRVKVVATFVKGRVEATKLLNELNNVETAAERIEIINQAKHVYKGNIYLGEQNLAIELKDSENGDYSYIILNNPPTISNYIGGIGTVNSISRGREHNPCVQYMIISKKVINKPDGELYNELKLGDYSVNLDDAIGDIISLFKRIYLEKNEINEDLTDSQKTAIIQNKLEYYFYEIVDANMFRFAKVSNKDDDAIYRLILEEASDD